MNARGFATHPVKMESRILPTLPAPIGDVDRIMGEVTAVTPLGMGRYDGTASQSGPGTERYRPLEDAAAGPEPDLRQRPGVVEVSFERPDDRAILDRVLDAISKVHSDREPVIRRVHGVASRPKELDDSRNANRWWNTTGDWASAVSGDRG